VAKRLTTDWTLFLTIVVLVFFGLIMVYSASSVIAEKKYHAPPYHFLMLQFGWAIVSLFVLMYIKRQDYRMLKTPAFAFAPLGLVIVSLVIVYFLDPRSHRWLRFGIGGIQPSEFAKPALVIFLAYFVTWRARAINSNRYTLLPACLVMGMLFLFVGIADLGTAVVLSATAATIFYVAGVDRKYFRLAMAGMGLVILVFIASKGYRVGRLIGFFDPEYKILDQIDPHGYVKTYARGSSATSDQGYQQRQSKIAVGSGGPLGLGLMQGKQKLFYLPEAHTDFIYAVVGEELGLWGSASLLAGFIIILWRGFRLFLVAPDDFGRYLALGVTATVVFQAMMNMSVVLELGPTKGIPLPMISYGGSSLLSTLISLGILLSVSEQAG
jgi:cell division protein FtsW